MVLENQTLDFLIVSDYFGFITDAASNLFRGYIQNSSLRTFMYML